MFILSLVSGVDIGVAVEVAVTSSEKTVCSTAPAARQQNESELEDGLVLTPRRCVCFS
jgi:hypothetical protein